MLSCDNICHGGNEFRVGSEKVGAEGKADTEQQLGIDGGAVVDALQRAGRNTDAVGQPFIVVALPPHFLANQVAYMYLHDGCYLCAILPIPW